MVGVTGLGWWAVVGPALAAPPAGAAPAVNCSAGVIVAADFAPWGGDVNSVCDPTLPANAADVLVDTKFDPVGVAQYGLAFICQIAGDPPDDSCATTPPADAYWSFWYADAGDNTWQYSQSGATNLQPEAGSVEAWIFGGNTGASPPSAFPSPKAIRAATARTSGTTTSTPPAPPPTSLATTPATAASTPPPATTPPPSAGGGTGGSEQPSTTVPVAGLSSADRQGGTASAESSTRPRAPTVTGRTGKPHRDSPDGAPAATEPSIPKIVDAAPAVAARPAGGSPLPFVIGAVAVAALAATGGLMAWRRRRTE
jgi:hypothetical protein